MSKAASLTRIKRAKNVAEVMSLLGIGDLSEGTFCFLDRGEDNQHYLSEADPDLHQFVENEKTYAFKEYIELKAPNMQTIIKDQYAENDKSKSRSEILTEIYEVPLKLDEKEKAEVNLREHWQLVKLRERYIKAREKINDRLITLTTLQPHPINLDVLRRILDREPIVSAAIQANAEAVIQPGFEVEVSNQDGTQNKEAKRILQDFIEDPAIQFNDTVLKNALINYDWAGNSFQQPVVYEGEIVRIFNHDPETMFVETDGRGTVFGYWEFSSQVQEHFFPFEILHWKRNAVVEDPYGYSVIHPLVETVKRKLNVWADAVRTLHRYGSPLILWIFGNSDIPRFPKDQITTFINNLKSHPSNDIGAPYGVDGKTLGSDFKVALNYIQYLEEIRSEMCGGLRTPGAAIGLPTKGDAREELETYDKYNQTRQRLLANNVMIPIFQLELALKNKGIRKNIITVRWNRFERIERDKKEQNIVKMDAIGIITPNEAREMIGKTTPIVAYDPLTGKEIPHYGDAYMYPVQRPTTGSPGQTFNSNKVNPATTKSKQPAGKVTKQ